MKRENLTNIVVVVSDYWGGQGSSSKEMQNITCSRGGIDGPPCISEWGKKKRTG